MWFRRHKYQLDLEQKKLAKKNTVSYKQKAIHVKTQNQKRRKQEQQTDVDSMFFCRPASVKGRDFEGLQLDCEIQHNAASREQIADIAELDRPL